MSTFTDEVVRICTEELDLFGGGKLKEYDKKVYRRVGDYGTPAKTEKYKTWKGYDGRSDNAHARRQRRGSEVISDNQPRSAASPWAVRTAGGDSFRYAPSPVYIAKALHEAKNTRARPSSSLAGTRATRRKQGT
jgi:hypothetical protein